MLKTISIDELEVGMFVQDIKLKNSKYKVKNRGKVNSQRTIDLLKHQGAVSIVVKLDSVQEQLDSAESNPTKSITSNDLDSNDFAQSHQLYDQATESVKQLFAEAGSGKQLTTENMTELAGEITESVMHNEYAITILTQIRQQSNYQWEHAINTAVLTCGFGLYLGIKKDILEQMTLGALFHDIGTARVPRAIIEKNAALTKNERSVMEKHVHWGVEIGKRDNVLNNIIIDMLVNHHERLDGSGYPRGIGKDKLSRLARIFAIIDVYDAMTADKNYRKGVHPMSAMRYLLSHEDKFDAELVQQFIKFLGVYPVGSLVQLSNEKLGIVTEGNREEPLKPTVEVIYSTKINALTTPKTCDLKTIDIKILSAVRGEDFQINLPKLIRQISL